MKYALAASLVLLSGMALAQTPPDPAQAHLVAAKKAAGLDFSGTLARVCVAPGVNPGSSGAPGAIPDRASWYAAPHKVFDNLYWVGTKEHSSWALKGRDGIILIDTLYNYAAEPEIVDGLKTLGLDPASIKYVVVTHGHGDHDEGAKLLQDRFGAHIVMSAPDWDLMAQHPPHGGLPKRDMLGEDGQVITLGDVSVKLIATPGHTLGTLSAIFMVRDHGRPLTVVYSGGTAIAGFDKDAARLGLYIASQKKLADGAAAAGATVLLSNHSEFDRAYDKARLTELRQPGEPSPFEVGADAIARYFTVTGECAELARAQAGG